jgi:hypothetical protein
MNETGRIAAAQNLSCNGCVVPKVMLAVASHGIAARASPAQLFYDGTFCSSHAQNCAGERPATASYFASRHTSSDCLQCAPAHSTTVERMQFNCAAFESTSRNAL